MHDESQILGYQPGSGFIYQLNATTKLVFMLYGFPPWPVHRPLGQFYEPGSLRRGDGAPLAHAALDVGHDVYGCTPYVSL